MISLVCLTASKYTDIDFGRWVFRLKLRFPHECYSHCCGGTGAVVSEPLFVVPSVLTYHHHHQGNVIIIPHGGRPADLHVHVCTSIQLFKMVLRVNCICRTAHKVWLRVIDRFAAGVS